ncbi:MAG: DNA-3-methyladenine glycosylase 2 family protein [Oscillospiraceae bacterium]|nr:DNA-3-methyladenine glycosylase 2 family protein [Oscillospiraceae bacterium]
MDKRPRIRGILEGGGMKAIHTGDGVFITDTEDFSPALTFSCGQCFRFTETDGAWRGAAFGRDLTVTETPGGVLLSCPESDFYGVWHDYFDLGRDYAAARERVAVNDFMRAAAGFGRGIRILRQDFWEALCSFIISQNNNIPRIRGVITRLCAYCADADLPPRQAGAAFPNAATVLRLSVDELRGLGAGYRAEYILDAARAVENGALSGLSEMTVDGARQALMRVRGVGVKVADCVLLYGLGRMDAFPLDVWMKRALSERFAENFDPRVFGGDAGIAQQYIFHYIRYLHGRA